MTEDASAGRLYADVIADTSGFRRDLEAKLKAELAKTKAKVDAEIKFKVTQVRTALKDTLAAAAGSSRPPTATAQVQFKAAQVRRALNAALKEAAKASTAPTVKAEFSPEQLRRALSKSLAQATRGLSATVDVDVDDTEAQYKLSMLGRDKTVDVDTDADTSGADRGIDGMRRRQESKPVKVKVEADQNALMKIGEAVTSLTRFPAIASGIMLAAGAITNLAGGLYSVVASASQAAGVLAAFPNLIGAAAQGMGTLLLGFSGIGEVVKGLQKSQQAAGAAATKSAASQVAAAEQVKAAQERLARAQQDAAERVAEARKRLALAQEQAGERQAEAERRVADASEQAAERIQTAQRRLAQVESDGAQKIVTAQGRIASAHADVQRAVEDLQAATESAMERQKDLALQVSGAALDEEAAQIALTRAKKRLADITGPGSTASALDKQEADLEYRQAEQRLKEIQLQNQRLAQEKQESDEKGVQGSDQVVAAQERVTAAVQAEQAAREELGATQREVAADIADAQAELVKAQRDGARDIADAQADLARTQRDNARSIADAQAAIVKAQRDGARSVADAQRAISQAMRSGAAAAGGTSAAVTSLNAALDNLSPAGQRFARFISNTLMPRFKDLRFAVQEALLPPLQKAITKALPLLDVIQKGLVGTGKVIGGFTLDLADLMTQPAFKRDMGDIMASNNRALTDFGKAAIPLIDILRRVADVAGPVLLEPFAKWTRQVAEAANASDRLSKSRIRDFLERARDTAVKLAGIIGNVVGGLYNLGRAARPTGDTMLDDLAEAAKEFNKWTADPANQARIKAFFDNTLPLMRELGDLLNRVVGLFLRFGEATGGGTFDGLFWILNTLVSALEKIADLPAGGTILTTIFTLAGVGMGLGLVAKMFGGLVKNIGRLARFTGVGKILDKIGGLGRKGGKKGGPGGLADDVDDLTDAIDKELPKDKKKTDAVTDIGDAAGDTSTKAKDLGDKVDDVGKKAETSAKKTGIFRRALNGLGKGVKTGLGKVGSLAGLLLTLPGVGAVASWAGKFASQIGSAISTAFGKLGVGKAAGKAGGVLGGLGTKLLGTLALPSAGTLVSKVAGWAKGLLKGIGGAIGKIFTGGGLAKLAGGALKGGGILGIVASLLGGVIGGDVGGALQGGATGATIGGVVGSIVPGIGTALGTAIGAIIGAITGGGWWDDIAKFFTQTLPHWIADQAKKLPGILGGLLSKAADLGMVILTWLGQQAQKLPGLIGQALLVPFKLGLWVLTDALPAMLGWALRELPGLIVRVILGIPLLILKAITGLANVFGWLLTHAIEIGPKIYAFIMTLPFKIAAFLIEAGRRAPQAFAWLSEQAGKIKDAVIAKAKALWADFLAAAAKGLADAKATIAAKFSEIGAAFAKAKDDFVKAMRDAWASITSGVATAWANITHAVGEKLADLRKAFSDAKAAVVARLKEAWSSITSNAAAGLAAARQAVADKLAQVKNAFVDAKNAVVGRIKEAMSSVQSALRAGMDKAHQIASDILGKIKTAFSTAKEAIGKIWDGLKGLLKSPVNWIGSNVYQKGIKWTWDKVVGLVGGKLKPLPDFQPFASGGVLPGYTPGRDIMTLPAFAFSGGEAVMRPEWTRAVGSKFVDWMNLLARTRGVKGVRDALGGAMAGGMPGFANGGIIGRFANGGILGKIGDLMSGFAAAAKDGFLDGVRKAAGVLLHPIVSALGGLFGGTGWGQGIIGVPPKFVGAFLDFLGSKVEAMLGGDAAGVVKAAASMIGQGDDRGPNNNWITRKWGMVGAPWCAMFVSEAIDKAKAHDRYAGHPSAAVASYVNAMKKVPQDQGRPGDLGAYRGFGHINVIEKNLGGGVYRTIGGNENALIRRNPARGGQTAILRPTAGHALGGIIKRQAARIWGHEVFHTADPHEMDTPLSKLMAALGKGSGVSRRLVDTMMRLNLTVADQDRVSVRDNGGPLYPGFNAVLNNTGGLEWVLTPEAVALLGGPKAVQTLNDHASLYQSGRSARSATAVTAAPARAAASGTVNVFPQPKQSEYEIGMIAARKLGAMLR